MKETFYTKLPGAYTLILLILFTIVVLLSLGLLFNLTYDFFCLHKYWLNRRILNKYLNNKDLVFIKRQILESEIIEYEFENFTVWKYSNNLQIGLHTKYEDIIGLYTCSILEDQMVIKIIRKLNKLKYETHKN